MVFFSVATALTAVAAYVVGRTGSPVAVWWLLGAHLALGAGYVGMQRARLHRLGLLGPGAEPSEVAQAHALPRAMPQEAAALARRLSGKWVKDSERSDPMDMPARMAELNWLFRKALNLIMGIHISMDADTFDYVLFSKIPFINVIEKYRTDGTEHRFRRRDLRGGGATGTCLVTRESVVLTQWWNDPIGGVETDTFTLLDENTLKLRCWVDMEGKGRHFGWTLVYRKKHS